jgi:hypothetical protein
VKGQNGAYAYWAFMHTLTSASPEAKNGLLKTACWDEDSIDMECSDVTLDILNRGYYKRSLAFRKSNKRILFGPLLTDFTTCGGLLFTDSEYTIRLFRQPHAFSLMSHEAGANYIVNIRRAELYVTKHTLSSDIPRSINFTQIDTRIRTIEAGKNKVDFELYDGNLPKKVIILQVLPEAYYGKYKKNPFNLQRFNATNISVLVNGVALPADSNMITMDESLSNIYHVMHHQLYGLGIEDSKVLLPAIEQYRNGTFFWPVNLEHEDGNGVLRLVIDYMVPHTICISCRDCRI